jgi:TonB family protein
MRTVIFVADHVTKDMNDDAYVIVKVDIDDSGLVTHPELHQTSGSTLFDRAIVNGLKRRPNCPPRPPEAVEYSQRTRIRVPVRESD